MPNHALAQLRDIHLPPPVSWWPLAPGWYIVLALLAIAIVITSFYAYRYYVNGRARRQALQLLDSYVAEYQSDENSQQASAKISELLRRVALVYFPRKEVASLQGEAWLAFLNQTGNTINFTPVRTCLLELPYQSAGNLNIKPLFTRARAWIKQRRKPCLD